MPNRHGNQHRPADIRGRLAHPLQQARKDSLRKMDRVDDAAATKKGRHQALAQPEGRCAGQRAILYEEENELEEEKAT